MKENKFSALDFLKKMCEDIGRAVQALHDGENNNTPDIVELPNEQMEIPTVTPKCRKGTSWSRRTNVTVPSMLLHGKHLDACFYRTFGYMLGEYLCMKYTHAYDSKARIISLKDIEKFSAKRQAMPKEEMLASIASTIAGAFGARKPRLDETFVVFSASCVTRRDK